MPAERHPPPPPAPPAALACPDSPAGDGGRSAGPIGAIVGGSGWCAGRAAARRGPRTGFALGTSAMGRPSGGGRVLFSTRLVWAGPKTDPSRVSARDRDRQFRNSGGTPTTEFFQLQRKCTNNQYGGREEGGGLLEKKIFDPSTSEQCICSTFPTTVPHPQQVAPPPYVHHSTRCL